MKTVKYTNPLNALRKGFTLVEVLIVAIIISILASVAVSTAFNARKGAAEATLSAIVTDVNKAMQRAALLLSDEAIPFTISSGSACTAIKEAIAGLAFCNTSNLGSADTPYTISIAKPDGSGDNAVPIFTADSAKKMIDTLNQYFNEDGTPYTGTDREVKYELELNDSQGYGSWGKYQFYLNTATSN